MGCLFGSNRCEMPSSPRRSAVKDPYLAPARFRGLHRFAGRLRAL